MFRQFGQLGFQPLPGQTWQFPLMPMPMPMPMPTPTPTPTPTPVPPMQPMTFNEMYAILGEMYEMIRCMYEQEVTE